MIVLTFRFINVKLCNPGVNAMLRKVAGAAAAKPHVEIRQDGEQFYIKTSTSVRTTEINFRIGEEFDEETLDGRKCKVSHCDGWHQKRDADLLSFTASS